MSSVSLARTLRSKALGFAVRRRGTPDLSTLQRFPESATYPIRRRGTDPVPELAEARDREPVTRLARLLGMNVWLVTRYDEARAVLADGTTWSNDVGHLLGTRGRSGAEGVGGLGMTDDPDHARLRRLLTPEFTRRRLNRLAPRIEAIVDETLDGLTEAAPMPGTDGTDAGGATDRGDGVVDLVPDFAFAVPFRVICELLGLPVEDRAAFHALGAARFDAGGGLEGVFGAATQSREFLIGAVARQRADPGPGLIGALVRDHGSEFDDVEFGGLADGVFLGGYETSASMLAMGTHVLMQHPDAWQTVRTGDDAAVDAIIEELLRYLCPVQVAFPRFARHDLDLADHRIRRGDVVIVSLSGANRDAAAFPHPDDFTPRGGASSAHLAFGHGLHRCVGAELARLELRAALRGVTRRFPDLVLACEPEDLAFRELSFVHGLSSLPVHLHGVPQDRRSASLRAAT